MRVVVLDNEAVQALGDPAHPKHRRVTAHLRGAVHRRRRGREIRVVVPTAVRVEAGWDRTAPSAAAINRLRVADRPLDTAAADIAAAIARQFGGVTVADAHVGATIRTLGHDEAVVLTSDPEDIQRVAGDRRVITVRI
jgi:predicted nucleic acid-binding protein